MAEATVAKSAVDQLTERLVLLADKIAENAGPAGEAAWNVTMMALRLEAIAKIGLALLTGVLAIVLLKMAAAQWARVGWAGAQDYGDITDSKASTGRLFAVAVLFVFGGIAAIGTVVDLLTAQTWITAVSPEAGMALRILNGL